MPRGHDGTKDDVRRTVEGTGRRDGKETEEQMQGEKETEGTRRICDRPEVGDLVRGKSFLVMTSFGI